LDVLAPDSTSLREEFEQWRLREGHCGGLRLRTCYKKLASSLVGRRILPHAQRLDQRNVKEDEEHHNKESL
jgi:hypothetical protein